jgi:hypothetical protein
VRTFVIALTLMLLPGLAAAATPPEGVALTVRRGFFTETDVGVFFTLGGKNQYSNGQTYLQLGIGYDLTEHIEIGGHFGIGANAQNCFVNPQERGVPCEIREGGQRVDFPDNFTVTFFDLTAAYLFRLADRFYLAPKLAAGYTLLNPAPLPGVTSGVNLGGGIGVEYATHMDHFSIGADALVRFITGPNITTIAIFPRVKYTF